jgi:hypothetical protein
MMSMLLRLMNEVDRCLRNNHVEDVVRRGGQGPPGRANSGAVAASGRM